MIQVKNITKKYRNTAVVDNVSLTIPEGTVTSIIGPNGAGKSTLLSIISRLIYADRGEIIIDDVALENWDKNQLSKTISILRQENNTNIKITTYELVSFGRFPHSKGRLTEDDKEYIDKAIAYMELDDIRDKYIDELSGGQRQRAFIAMTIAQDTKYIFLDEPLNNLDMKHAVQMMKILRGLAKDMGKTIITVLHDINFSSVYSDYILALKDGNLYSMDKTDNVINRESLSTLYDMDIDIQEINNKNICVYY